MGEDPHDERERLERLSKQGDTEARAELVRLLQRQGIFEADDAKRTPWHPDHCPSKAVDIVDWVERCQAWCATLSKRKAYDMRTHLKCGKCKFGFVYRTSYYHLGSDSDVQNFGICCNPDCKYEWDEWA